MRPAGLAAGLGAATVIALSMIPSSLIAQEDFRASDPGRPLRVDDAIPLKLREWEIAIGLRGAAREAGSAALGALELEAGLFRNAQVGIEVEGGVEDRGDAAAGLESIHGHVLYQIGRETPGLPAVALRAGIGTPGAGSIGHDAWSASAAAVATRSFGRFRVHLNGGYGVMGDADGGDYWDLGVGFDYPIGLFSRAILGAVSAEIPTGEGRSRVWAEIGSRWQISNWSVLDVGLSTRLDQWEAGNANVELVVGLSRVFGIAGLLRVPPWPDPTIR